MKKSRFSKKKKNSLTKLRVVTFSILFFTLTSCSDSNDLEYEIISFQQEVDSILINVIAPKKDSLHAQIKKNKKLSQENVDIAYQVIPINTAQFLISSQSDTLTNSLKLYKSKKINAKVLKEKLSYSKFYIDSLLRTNVVMY